MEKLKKVLSFYHLYRSFCKTYSRVYIEHFDRSLSHFPIFVHRNYHSVNAYHECPFVMFLSNFHLQRVMFGPISRMSSDPPHEFLDLGMSVTVDERGDETTHEGGILDGVHDKLLIT